MGQNESTNANGGLEIEEIKKTAGELQQLVKDLKSSNRNKNERMKQIQEKVAEINEKLNAQPQSANRKDTSQWTWWQTALLGIIGTGVGTAVYLLTGPLGLVLVGLFTCIFIGGEKLLSHVIEMAGPVVTQTIKSLENVLPEIGWKLLGKNLKIA